MPPFWGSEMRSVVNQPFQHNPISEQLKLNKPVLFLSLNSH